MNVNASIIDQRLSKLVDSLRERAADELNIRKPESLKSLTFVYLCLRLTLDLDDETAFDCLVEGGGDFGIDAIHISDVYNGEFKVSLFQGKYKQKLDGTAGFPASGLEKMVQALDNIFDPRVELASINERLRTHLEFVRSLISDGNIPNVRVIACNNGKRWESNGEDVIRLARNRLGASDQIQWDHVNHDRLVQILQSVKKVNDVLRLSGKAIVEDMNFTRVLIGRVRVEEVASLIKRHGERLLERNIRRYLGLQGNRVNEGMRDTLESGDRENFYFYNNGITLTCDKFVHNAFQGGDFQVQVENLQIINGGQTCMTIFKTLQQNSQPQLMDKPAYVLVRLYQLPPSEGLASQITFATNSQNPVDLRDLRSNDRVQRRLQLDIEQLGYVYKRMRTQETRSSDITSGTAAAAVLSVWRGRPNQAKFFGREHFGKLYPLIFSPDLTGAEVVIAVLLFRFAENRRKRPVQGDPIFVRYGSCFIAMRMGSRLMRFVNDKKITHTNFTQALEYFKENAETLFDDAVSEVKHALTELYGDRDISRQQLAATFRRGDLLDILVKGVNRQFDGLYSHDASAEEQT